MAGVPDLRAAHQPAGPVPGADQRPPDGPAPLPPGAAHDLPAGGLHAGVHGGVAQRVPPPLGHARRPHGLPDRAAGRGGAVPGLQGGQRDAGRAVGGGPGHAGQGPDRVGGRRQEVQRHVPDAAAGRDGGQHAHEGAVRPGDPDGAAPPAAGRAHQARRVPDAEAVQAGEPRGAGRPEQAAHGGQLAPGGGAADLGHLPVHRRLLPGADVPGQRARRRRAPGHVPDVGDGGQGAAAEPAQHRGHPRDLHIRALRRLPLRLLAAAHR